VNQPRESGEGRGLEDSDAAGFALDPVWVGSGRRDRQEGLSYLAELTARLKCFRGRHHHLSINRRGTRVSIDCETQYHWRNRFCVAAYGKAAAVCRTPSGGGNLIVGMGVDIAEVDRIQGAIERHGEVFLRRIFTTREREYCERFKNKYERYAGRFAAKEAAMKALGTGWRRGVKWVDLEVVRETSGRPTLSISGEAAKIAQQIGVKSVALSITHTESQALAQVIFEG
jgi:holo-[acyl-carrier protein] synthase